MSIPTALMIAIVVLMIVVILRQALLEDRQLARWGPEASAPSDVPTDDPASDLTGSNGDSE